MERAELKSVLRATGCAVEVGEFVFLCDPNWTEADRTSAQRQMAMAHTTEVASSAGWLGVRTGGSSGEVKFARHDETTLGAAVRGFCRHFRMTRVNTVDVLPAYHVSGLMARVRSAATGGAHLAWDWQRLESGDNPNVAGDEWVLSLVPTQLQRLLRSRALVEWLRQLRIIFVGGGPVWSELADAAAAANLRVAPGYGMTETAAMVAALQPEDFLAGMRSSGTAMPHAQLAVDGMEGRLTIAGASIFRGYWPAWHEARAFTTEDLGQIDPKGHLHIWGRRDAMILSGGKKVNATEVEKALQASGEFADVAVVGMPDHEWGEAVVACFRPEADRTPDLVRAVAKLASCQRPKRFVEIAEWPRNAHGKVNRAALRERIIERRFTPGDAKEI